jgi:hypothetical protein
MSNLLYTSVHRQIVCTVYQVIFPEI